MLGQRKIHPWLLLSAVLIVVIVGVSSIVAYWMPYLKLRAMNAASEEWRSTGERLAACQERGDQACVEKAMREYDAVWKTFQRQAMLTDQVMTSPEFIDAIRHHDGSLCFFTLPGGQAPTIPREELVAWLKAYGEKRYLDLAPIFLRGRHVIEQTYHQPTPFAAFAEAAAGLKRRHVPLTREWRMYNTASYLWNNATATDEVSPSLPEPLLAAVIPALRAHPDYFTTTNVLAMLDDAKAALTHQRLHAVANALQRYRSEQGAFPLQPDGKALNLNALIAENYLGPRDLPDQGAAISDWWSCPIEGRIQDDGLVITSLGYDCTSGGEGASADIAIVAAP